MPIKYHLIIGGKLAKYTNHRWLLYTLDLGGVKTHRTKLRYSGNDVKCDFHTAEGEISTSIFTVLTVYYCQTYYTIDAYAHFPGEILLPLFRFSP